MVLLSSPNCCDLWTSNAMTTVQLVPPSLDVIASLIARKKNPQYCIESMLDRISHPTSLQFAQLRALGYPPIQFTTDSLGDGLAIALTRTEALLGHHALVWISMLSCHPFCAFLGRKCQGNLREIEWLQKVEKKHRQMLDKLRIS